MVAASGFSRQQIPFSDKSSMYWRQSHRFLSKTPLKTGVKPQKTPFKNLRKTASETVVSPGVYFLISYTLAQIDAWFLYHYLQFRLSVLPSLLILLILVILILVWWCSAKKVFLRISQISHEKSCTKVSFLKKLQIHRV